MATFVEGADLPDDVTTPLTLTGGDVLNGSYNEAGDRDFVRISVEANTIYTIQLNDRDGNTDPFLRLLLPNGALLATNDDGGSVLNSALAFVSNITTDLYVSVESFLDASVGNYALIVGSEPVEPTLGPSTRAGLYNGEIVSGEVSSNTDPEDDDSYMVQLFGGRTYEFRGFNDSLFSNLAIAVHAPDWNGQLSENEVFDTSINDPEPRDVQVTYTAPATGAYFVTLYVGSFDSTGGQYSATFVDTGADATYGTDGEDTFLNELLPNP